MMATHSLSVITFSILLQSTDTSQLDRQTVLVKMSVTQSADRSASDQTHGDMSADDVVSGHLVT